MSHNLSSSLLDVQLLVCLAPGWDEYSGDMNGHQHFINQILGV